MASYENHLVHRRAVREGLENLRVNRRALRVVFVFLGEDDLLYSPSPPGDFTDYGLSPEYFALELARCLYYVPRMAPPPTFSVPATLQYTHEELEAALE